MERKRYHNQPGIVGGPRPQTLRSERIEKRLELMRSSRVVLEKRCPVHGLYYKKHVFPSGGINYQFCKRCFEAALKRGTKRLHLKQSAWKNRK